MPFIESADEWNARQGGQYTEVREGDQDAEGNKVREGFFVYANGARCSLDGEERCDPPADPHERARWIAVYWEWRVKWALDAFDRVKEMAISAGQQALATGECPAQDILDRLRVLRAEVRRLNKHLAAARDEVERTRPAADEERDAKQARARRHGAEYLTEVKSIRL
jgi:hypothetical protein